MARIFLSHSSRDVRQAIALKQWLAEHDPPLANDIFLDVDAGAGLRAGTRWKEALRRANARCEAVICLLSPNWEASNECKVEYRTAENLNKQIFCARLQPSTGDDLTSEWQRCDLFGDGPSTRVDIGDGAEVVFATDGLHRLLDGIRHAGIGADSFAWPPPGDPGRAPYRGWEPLEAADAAVFFGRDAEIVRALDAIRGIRVSGGAEALFVVLGPSGTGKSSFLRAGLLPRLRREDRRFAVLDIVRPERNALTGETGLAAAICATRKHFGLDRPSLGEVKAACTAGDLDTLAGWLTEIREEAAHRFVDHSDDQDAPPAPTLVLPLDQAEELFSADAAEPADKFLRVLAGLAERLDAAEVGLVVVATIRTDRYEVMQTDRRLAGVGTVLFNELKPMPPTQFKEVIVGPAQRATDGGHPLRVAPDLVERLLDDAGKGADTLPILALTLSRLYADYASTGQLQLEHYEALGGMQRVVQTEIDEVLSTDPDQRAAQLAALRGAFVPWLATVNPDNDQPMRRVARFSDLPEASRPVIDALVGKRLMVKDTRDGDTVVEVALESLLRQWDELAGWLREQRQDLKRADDLERAAASWAENNREADWLLAGSRLTDAETLANTAGFRQRLVGAADYLAASRDAENQRLAAAEQQREAELRVAQERQATAEAHAATLRKRSRIMRAVLAVTAVAAVVAAVGFVWATNANREAQRQFREATSERLTAEAQGMLAGTRSGTEVRALQQVLAARSLTRSPDDDALYDTVIHEADTDKILEPGTGGFSARFSPDGRVLAVGGGDGKVRLWDAGNGTPLTDPLAGHTGIVEDVAFSPDGRLLASFSDDRTVRFWDLTSFQQRGEPFDVGAEAGSIAFTPDGRRLAVGRNGGLAQLVDVATRTWTGPQMQTGGGDSAVAVTPDGRSLATAGSDGVVRLWDIETGSPAGEFMGHTNSVSGLSFSPDGTRLASSSYDMTVRQWDVATGKLIGAPLNHNREVIGVAYGPTGHRLLTAVQNNLVLWDADSATVLGASLTGHSGFVFGLAFNPDGRHVASTGTDATVRLWDISDREKIAGWSVAFGPDGRLAIGGADGLIQFWDPSGMQFVGRPLAGPPGTVNGLLYSPDGQHLASMGADGVRLWDVGSGGSVALPSADDGASVTSIAFSPDKHRNVIGYDDGSVRVCDAATGQLIGSAFNVGDSEWRVADVAFVSEGRDVAAIYEGGEVKMWDANSGDERSAKSLAATVTAAAFATGGNFGVGSVVGQVSFFDAGATEPRNKDPGGHDGMVTTMTFSSDGRRAATGGRDQTVRMFDAEHATPIGKALVGLGGTVQTVALSADGALVAGSSAGGVVRIWPAQADPEDLCGKLTQNMSEKHWDEWVSADIDYIKACPDLPLAPN